ncbi:MAG TPA: dienelactone hydrolase family protein, partial [Gemmatimonadaceae bacterium]|nr:dienelactone hydrolase family protein [Gemmatimonadaceae bacterium]
MYPSRFLVAVLAMVGAGAACHRAPPADEHTAHMAAGDMALPAPNVTAAQGDPKIPPSANSAPARLKASPRHAEWVKIAWEPGSTDSLMAYIVYPSTANAKTPVVVVIHEIFGLQTWVRGVADHVAAEGFIAIAPDLESRVRGGPSTDELAADSAQKLIRGVNAAERNKGIAAAATFAMSQASAAPRYAVIGYCWGGSA